MKAIIVATDFSKEAENSLEYACEFANKINAKIVLFNSFSLPVSASNALLSAASFQELLDHNTTMLHKKARSFSATFGTEIIIETGFMDFSRALDGLFEKHKAVLLIMGMAPKSIEQDLFGNSTTAMIMKLKYPVLAVPYQTKFEGIKKILFAYDEVENKALFEKIKDLAVALGAEIEVFHVAKHVEQLIGEINATDATPMIAEVLKDVPHYFKNVESDKVVKVIEEEVINMNADLLIMVPQKYGFLESIIHRSKTRVMASNNKVPLLSIPIF
ncbi:universal stress protein [Pedobacter immunditicola]|uniref:universal stress protein n=1 Tax=Pedobacter immunditicola TaxID=3133440 RepID=UPI00309D520D